MPDGNVDKVREEIENVLRLSTINYGIQTEVKYTASRDHKYGERPAEVSVSLGSIKILESAVEEITGKEKIIKGLPYWSEVSFLIHDLNIP